MLFVMLSLFVAVTAGVAFADVFERTAKQTSVSGKRDGQELFGGAQFITNGGFESGDLSSWTMSVPLTIMVGSGGHSGSYYANLGVDSTPSTLSQTIADVSGTQLLFTFWVWNNNTVANSTFQVLWNGNQLLSQAPITVKQMWVQYSYTVTATGKDVISFVYYNPTSSIGLDDISVTIAPTPSPTPANATAPTGASGIISHNTAVGTGVGFGLFLVVIIGVIIWRNWLGGKPASWNRV